MTSNLNGASSIKLKDKMKSEICQACKILLDKYFEGREYNKDKINLWKNYTMDELSNFLKQNYENYGFCIFINIIKKGDIRINSNDLSRPDTDLGFFQSLETKYLFVEIRINFYKLYESNINLFNYLNEELVIKMNDILTNKLEGKSYSYEFAKTIVSDAVKELQSFLLFSKIVCCTFQICSIIKKPFEHQFSYNIINLDYIPLIVNFSNQYLYAQLILFLLGN